MRKLAAKISPDIYIRDDSSLDYCSNERSTTESLKSVGSVGTIIPKEGASINADAYIPYRVARKHMEKVLPLSE